MEKKMVKKTYLPAKQSVKHWSALTLSLLFLGFGAPAVLEADNLRSNSYIIQFGNFNMTAGEKSGGGYKVTDTVGQTAPGEYSSTGYKVYAGFQYIYAIPRFSFRLTKTHIELGLLTEGVFSQDSHQTIVTTRSGGYTLMARAEHPLQKPSQTASIPFTSCDAGCTTTTAESWIDAQNEGLGFNVTGTHALADFVSPSFFRPFADRSLAQGAAPIVQTSTVVRDDVHTITYKASISGSQEAGNYETSVEYTAIPSY